MTAATVEPAMWPRVRWWLAVILVVVVQVGLVFWLSDRSPIKPRSPATSAAVIFAEGALARLPMLTDPLLFSPDNPHGFSGAVWLKTPKLEYQLSDWTAPPSWLTLPVQQLGNAFSKVVQTDKPTTFAIADRPEPRLSSPELSLTDLSLKTQSTFRIEGELEQRPLVWPVVLGDLQATNILSPTLVQVMVDQDGNTVSAIVLSKSGSEDADKQGLNLAKTARYHSIRNNGTGQSPVSALNWGRLVFEWHTVPLTVTDPLPHQP